MVFRKKSGIKTAGSARAKRESLSVQGTPLVIGIGASAGGLRACRQLLEHLPADTGMAFVVVNHRRAARKGSLADLFSKITDMPVAEITRNTHVEPNHVYVNPS